MQGGSSSSATTPAPICCWREAAVQGPDGVLACEAATRLTRLDHNEPELNRSAPGDPNDTTTPAAMAGNVRRFLLGEVLSPGFARTSHRLDGELQDRRQPPACGPAGKPGGSATRPAITARTPPATSRWRGPGQARCQAGRSLICAYTQGGSPTPDQFTSVFTEIGRMVGEKPGLLLFVGRTRRPSRRACHFVSNVIRRACATPTWPRRQHRRPSPCGQIS